MAFAAAAFCLLLTVDELLPTREVGETVLRRYENRTTEGTSLYIDYHIETNQLRDIEVPIEIYAAIQSGDYLSLYLTPVFNQLKSFESTSKSNRDITRKGNPDLPRELPFIAGIVAMILGLVSVFVIKRFELKVALAFLTIVTTAVRWWFIGL